MSCVAPKSAARKKRKIHPVEAAAPPHNYTFSREMRCTAINSTCSQSFSATEAFNLPAQSILVLIAPTSIT
eukprot:1628923-Amphidinium_carterae.1